MAQQVHDMTGRTCFKCGKEFTIHSMNLTITIKKEDNMLIKRRVCGVCHSRHMEERE